MSIEIKLPDIGGDEVEVTEILVKAGEHVLADQSIMTVEGDKASMEIPMPETGTIKSILVKVGDKVKTGTPIVEIDASDAETPTVNNTTPAETEVTQKPQQIPTESTSNETEIAVPDIGGDQVEVTEILVRVGDTISADQSIMTVEGDKASMEIPSVQAGLVKALLVNVGDKVETGSKIAILTVNNRDSVTERKVASPNPRTPTAETEDRKTTHAVPVKKEETSSIAPKNQNGQFTENEAYAHATPSIRRLAREFGVNLANITPTGPKNRIVRSDVQAYLKKAVKQTEAGSTSGAVPGLLPWPNVDFNKYGDTEQAKLTKIQKKSGANLHRNWVIIPHVTEFDESDITELEAFRQQKNVEFEKQKLGIKVTPLVFIMKAVADALKKFPRFNSSLSENAEELIFKKYINIGVAVDTPNGLVVPVFQNIDKKGITELSRELAEMSDKARKGKLTGNDMQGGCFTISSLGGIGTTAFTPIVNAPEVGILGVSRSSIKPIWKGEKFEPRLMLPLSLSFDHRVIDGAEGARFLTHIVKVLADLRHLVM